MSVFQSVGESLELRIGTFELLLPTLLQQFRARMRRSAQHVDVDAWAWDKWNPPLALVIVLETRPKICNKRRTP